MPGRTIALEAIEIANPCRVPWEEMSGTERMRFCDKCQLHVYNLSAMTRREAEDLVGNRTGQTCLRLFRRGDGTVVTQDCQVLLADRLEACREKLARAGRLMLGGLVLTLLLVISALAIAEEVEKRRDGNRDRWGWLRSREPFRTVVNWLDPLAPPIPAPPTNCTMGMPPPPPAGG
jgi:hypothetical protein